MAGIAGFKGYAFLLGPEQVLRDVRTVDEYRARHREITIARGGTPWKSEEGVTASVNHGRWVADCFWCSTGMITRPQWGVAYCGECGAMYEAGSVRFHPRWRKIEAVLCLRLRRDQQHWDERQAVADLVTENAREDVWTA